MEGRRPWSRRFHGEMLQKLLPFSADAANRLEVNTPLALCPNLHRDAVVIARRNCVLPMSRWPHGTPYFPGPAH